MGHPVYNNNIKMAMKSCADGQNYRSRHTYLIRTIAADKIAKNLPLAPVRTI